MYNQRPNQAKLTDLETKLTEIINTYRAKGPNNIKTDNEKIPIADSMHIKDWIKSYKTSIRNHSSNALQYNSIHELNNSMSEEVIPESFVNKRRINNNNSRQHYQQTPPKYRVMQEYTARIYYYCVPNIDIHKQREVTNRIQKIKNDKLTKDKIIELKNKNHQKIKHFKVSLQRSDNSISLLPRIR
jgi:hypothetical protein